MRVRGKLVSIDEWRTNEGLGRKKKYLVRDFWACVNDQKKMAGPERTMRGEARSIAATTTSSQRKNESCHGTGIVSSLRARRIEEIASRAVKKGGKAEAYLVERCDSKRQNQFLNKPKCRRGGKSITRKREKIQGSERPEGRCCNEEVGFADHRKEKPDWKLYFSLKEAERRTSIRN